MKTLKYTKTEEIITGYEADDGHVFATEEECKKYEETARGVILHDLKQLMIGEPFAECGIWERFGYGSEEFMLAVIEIKNADDLHTVKMFIKAYDMAGIESITDEACCLAKRRRQPRCPTRYGYGQRELV